MWVLTIRFRRPRCFIWNGLRSTRVSAIASSLWHERTQTFSDSRFGKRSNTLFMLPYTVTKMANCSVRAHRCSLRAPIDADHRQSAIC